MELNHVNVRNQFKEAKESIKSNLHAPPESITGCVLIVASY